MTSILGQWLQNGMDVVFFFYGLAFLTMGLAILFQPRRESRFELADIIWLLAAFGLTHGANEFLDMWVMIKGRHPAFDIIRWGMLVSSYFFLFEFGRRAVQIGSPSVTSLPKHLHKYFGPIILLVVLAFTIFSSDFLNAGSTMARYLLGFPGAVLTGLGFFLYAGHEKEAIRTIKLENHFRCAALAFLAYGILGGLVVAEGKFFPASWFNTRSFLSATGIPVQIFRAACAVFITYCVTRILSIFSREADSRLRLAFTSCEARLKYLVSESSTVIYSCSAEPPFGATYITENAERLTGYAPENFTTNPAFWAENIHPDDAPRVLNGLSDVFKNSYHVHEYRWKRKDGTYFWMHDELRLVLDASGRPAEMVGNWVNVTKRKEAEKVSADLKEQFLQSQKMEAIGRLAGGIAHDFNNILTAINGYAGFAIEGLKPDDPRREDIEKIRKAGDRAAVLTRQILAFSRKQVFQSRVIRLNDLINEMDKMLRRVIGEDVALQTEFGHKLGNVRADVSQLEQVLMNLAVNARDAMQKGGRLVIQTANLDIQEPSAHGDLVLPAGRYVTISVADTGCGMNDDTRAHIFEPFFTTKALGKGTGLGLSTVYGIVKQSNGHISVASKVGEGTVFTIYLPMVEDSVETEDSNQPAADTIPGTETILLVEDDAVVRKTIGRILEGKGYSVTTAADAEEGLRLAEASKGPLHLLITDIILPGMDGLELSRRVLRLRPDIKMLYISGHFGDIAAREDVARLGSALLQKPFKAQELCVRVRQILDKAKKESPERKSGESLKTE
ncbi:MAG: ATP-binding protein [bacterium]